MPVALGVAETVWCFLPFDPFQSAGSTLWVEKPLIIRWQYLACNMSTCPVTQDRCNISVACQPGAEIERAQATALDQAHWKLYPPSQPVTSTTSPTK